MPVFDHRCHVCHYIFEAFEWSHEKICCKKCGAATEHIWLPGQSPTVIDDSIPGGMVIENIGPTPQKFYSKSDYRAAVAAAGLKPLVRHVGEPGSDKSKFTSRWI